MKPKGKGIDAFFVKKGKKNLKLKPSMIKDSKDDKDYQPTKRKGGEVKDS